MPLTGTSAGSVEGLVINPAFTGLVSAYGPEDIGLGVHFLFPQLTFQSNGNGMGYFVRYNLAENFQSLPDAELVRRTGTSAKKLNRSRRLETFKVTQRHLDAVVPWQMADLIRAQTGGTDDPNVTEVLWVRQVMLLQKEQRAAAAAQNPANVGSEITPVATWDDYTNGDPLGDLQTAMITVRQNSGLIPNTIAIPWEVAIKMAYHPRFRIATPTGGSVRKTTEDAAITAEALADLLKAVLGVDNVYILKSVANSTIIRRDPSLTLTNVWGKDVYVYYMPKEKNLNALLWGADIIDTFYYGASDSAGVFTFMDNDIESTIHRVREDSDIIILNPELAVAIRGAIV